MSDSPRAPDGAPDDETLVRRFQSGADPAKAIELLFERYAPMSFAFFCRSVGNRRVAEDLNQELFLEVIKSLRSFRLESSFKTWLFRVAYNHLSNLRRRLRAGLSERPLDAPDELWAELATDSSQPADDALLSEETNHRLRSCLARLPEIERAVVLGRYFRNTTLQELTDGLKLTNSSGARAYLIAAQRKLKRCMERSAATRIRARQP